MYVFKTVIEIIRFADIDKHMCLMSTHDQNYYDLYILCRCWRQTITLFITTVYTIRESVMCYCTEC